MSSFWVNTSDVCVLFGGGEGREGRLFKLSCPRGWRGGGRTRSKEGAYSRKYGTLWVCYLKWRHKRWQTDRLVSRVLQRMATENAHHKRSEILQYVVSECSQCYATTVPQKLSVLNISIHNNSVICLSGDVVENWMVGSQTRHLALLPRGSNTKSITRISTV